MMLPLRQVSVDKTIRIWNIKTGECIRILKGHSDLVSCLATLSNGYLASGSYDKTIRIWNSKNGKCLKTLKGHSEIIIASM